ncbi:MAG: hypothetical protein JWM11_3740 [Planctomycetaceae bacterium]|nr:hypothetical protein [Planctomycetaceae bacterium]
MTLTLEEAQAQLPEVIHRLQTGEVVVITEGNQVVAKIVGDRRPLQQRPEPGLGKGMLTILAEDDEHLKDFEDYLP